MSAPMPAPRDVLAAPARAEIEVTRSRFVCDLVPATTVAQAQAVVAAARVEFAGARHHCSAWVLGPIGQQVRVSDDGEPAGTAGAPMLAVLQGAELTDVVAVVTRWFGGTLLGAGGLVRAYGGAVSAALAQARRAPRRVVTPVTVAAPHTDAGRLEHHLRRWMDDLDGRVVGRHHGPREATLTVQVPRGHVDRLLAELAGSGLRHAVEVGEDTLTDGTAPGAG